jgi:hypothetical protein
MYAKVLKRWLSAQVEQSLNESKRNWSARILMLVIEPSHAKAIGQGLVVSARTEVWIIHIA